MSTAHPFLTFPTRFLITKFKKQSRSEPIKKVSTYYYYLKFILILVPHLPQHHLSGLFRFMTKTIMCIFLLIYEVYILYQSINLILWTYEIFKVAQNLRRSAYGFSSSPVASFVFCLNASQHCSQLSSVYVFAPDLGTQFQILTYSK